MNQKFRCVACGKYLSHESFEKGEVHIEFTPDTPFTVESIEYFHKKCYDRINKVRTGDSL